jgi:hypothetical protein
MTGCQAGLESSVKLSDMISGILVHNAGESLLEDGKK